MIPCEHVDVKGIHLPVENCHFCKLAVTNVRYAKLWDIKSANNPPSSKKNCVFLSGPVGETVDCPSCNGTVRLKLLGCEKHGKCTLEKEAAGFACCRSCPDYLERRDRPFNLLMLEEFQRRTKLREVPPELSGRGIVTCVGGSKYFACAWCQISMLRWLGCILPIEAWHLGPAEMDPKMKGMLESLGGVEVRDALAQPNLPRILNGWELKPFSVIRSRFAEVLFLDADCYPVLEPSFLFDCEAYKKHGSLFWPDLAPQFRAQWIPADVWGACGMAYQDEPDFESGQLMVDKRRCWSELQTTMWMNAESDYWYKLVFGDKSTWHLAWRGHNTPYGLAPACGWIHPAITQHAPDGRLIFVHACRGKEQIAAAERIPLVHGDKVQDAGRILTGRWRGEIWAWRDQNDEEMRLAEGIPGEYDYTRHAGTRALELLPYGEIGRGAAKCEKRWTLRIIDGNPTLVITGEAHKGTEVGMILFSQVPGGRWEGKWTAYERGAVSLAPRTHRMPPAGFLLRSGTWDRDIFDCICRDNEYDLPLSFEPGAVIIDLGAHIGAFSLACLDRGAWRVIAVEPESENFDLLRGNLARYSSRLETYKAAAWSKWSRGQLHGIWGHPNTGCWSAKEDDHGEVQFMPLDWLLEKYKRIRLLKLDIEGAEHRVLASCSLALLHNVEEIVGEYHNNGELVREALQAHGFETKLRPTADGLGLFRARVKCPS